MPRPKKYATNEERLAAQREQKRRSGTKKRREARGLDPLAPYSGEAGTGAKLTAAEVAELRKLRKTENWTMATLARKFGISQQQVSAILAGKHWQ